jgi:transposase
MTKASTPADIGPGTTFGPRLVSFFAALTVRLRASRRGLRQVAGDLLDVEPPSVGTLQHLLEELSEAALPAYQEVWAALKKSPVANADETRWYRLLLCYWLWTGVTTNLSFYRITENRNQEERRNLLGPGLPGHHRQ